MLVKILSIEIVFDSNSRYISKSFNPIGQLRIYLFIIEFLIVCIEMVVVFK